MDLHRIRKMAKVAKYAEKDTEGRLKIARYYRSDYIGIQLLKNIVLVTVGFAILTALFLAINSEDILDQIYTVDPGVMIYLIVILYIAVLVIYTALTYIYSTIKYKEAKKTERFLDHQLELLQRAYADQDDEDEGEN